MAEINREPHRFEDQEGNEFVIFDKDHTVTDMLNEIIRDVGFDEVEAVLGIMIENAKEAGTYEDNR